jgi:predicted nucleic acid-binding protein
MRIAITDANIFIDLFYLELVDHLFEIGCEIYTTRNVLLELEDHHAGALENHIKTGKLNLETLTSGDQLAMIRLRVHRGLSESDLSVICIAERLKAMVLTGDDLVRKTCHVHKIEIHGVLWCLDQFVIKNRIVKSEACEQLKKLMAYNKRLPLADCKKYISHNWGGEFE